MAYERYINAVDLAENIENLDITVAGKPARWNDAKYSVLQEIAEAPTADVVPREMFDRVFGNLKAVLEEISEDKAEVAREIFEEIEKIMERYLDSPLCNYHKIRIAFAELKKKYTEAETEPPKESKR